MNLNIGADAADWNAHTGTISGLADGLAKLIGVVFLFPMFKSQLYRNRSLYQSKSAKPSAYLITCVMAVFSSLALNIVIILMGLVETSETYKKVAEVQYGVPFALGLFLYGVAAPFTEELVFRGLIYNRLKKYYNVSLAVIVSALLFGAWHGNLVQALYGACMGILLAYVYERFNDFKIPCLFHAAANIAVYTVTGSSVLYDITVRWYNALIFMAASAFIIVCIEKRRARLE